MIRDQRSDTPAFDGWMDRRGAVYVDDGPSPLRRSHCGLLAVTQDTLPPYRNAALLLDLDGTLLDFAATPEAVVVPPGLLDALRTIRDQLGGALAVITGRTIEMIDRFLGDVPYAVAGEHGGAVRRGPAAAVERPDLKPPPQSWIDRGKLLETDASRQPVRAKAAWFLHAFPSGSGCGTRHPGSARRPDCF